MTGRLKRLYKSVKPSLSSTSESENEIENDEDEDIQFQSISNKENESISRSSFGEVTLLERESDSDISKSTKNHSFLKWSKNAIKQTVKRRKKDMFFSTYIFTFYIMKIL